MFYAEEEQIHEQEQDELSDNEEFKELILQCVQYANDLYKGELNDQQKASDFFNQWIEHPQAFIVSLQILKRYDDLYSNYAVLAVFKNIISNNWLEYEQENREELKELLFQILQSDRDHSIINMCSILLARIGIIEFPEIWENFLNDTLRLGNSLVLIYYLEDLENSFEIAQNRRILVHQIFISSFDDIKNAIFDRFDMSAGSIRLYSLISLWTPLSNVINEMAIELLTTVLMSSENTRENAIECLDIIFVQRYDCKSEFPRIHNLLLNNLYVQSKIFPECAVLLAKILCAHLDFFGIETEYVEKVTESIDPSTSVIDEEGNEVLVFNLCLPKYKTVEIHRKKYLNYEAFNQCFLLLSDPGWCNYNGENIEYNEDADGIEHGEEEARNEEDAMPENNGNNENNEDDSSDLVGPELYWSTWNKFLTFANGLECEKEDNCIINNIPLIFGNMSNFILNASDLEMMINSDAQSCYLVMIKNDPDFVISQLESQENSINLLYVSCCCLKGMTYEYANEFISRFFVADENPYILSHTIRCMSFLLRLIPENEALIQFYIDSLTFSANIQPSVEELEISACSSLMFLSTYSPQVFYYDDYQLLKFLCSLISNIEINTSLSNVINHSFFIIAARVISDISIDEISTQCIKDVTSNLTSYIYENCDKIIGSQQEIEEFDTFFLCITTLTNISQRCFRLAEVEGENLLQSAFSIICTKSSKERDLELIGSCYELSSSIILCSINWIMAEIPTKSILKTAVEGEISQFGLALQFLTKIHRKFPESNSLFPSIYDNIVQYLMAEIVEDSKFVLDYLLSARFWDFQFSLPLGFMKAVIKEFPHVCTKPALLITKEYCFNYQLPYIETFLANEGIYVFRFLIEILINSMFNIYFPDIVRCFMALFLAIYQLGFDADAIAISLIKVLEETFPDLKPNDLVYEDNDEVYEEDEEDMQQKKAYKKKLFIFDKFMHSCLANYMDQQIMEKELRELVISSHCCLPTISNLFPSPQNSNNDSKGEAENHEEQQDFDQEDEIEKLFNDINDEDFDS